MSRLGAVLAQPLIWLVMAYQLLISPLLGPTCKYYPSCSAYAVSALKSRGPLGGLWLTACRLLRCHPWSHGGVDHVPPRAVVTPLRASPGEASRSLTREQSSRRD